MYGIFGNDLKCETSEKMNISLFDQELSHQPGAFGAIPKITS